MERDRNSCRDWGVVQQVIERPARSLVLAVTPLSPQLRSLFYAKVAIPT